MKAAGREQRAKKEEAAAAAANDAERLLKAQLDVRVCAVLALGLFWLLDFEFQSCTGTSRGVARSYGEENVGMRTGDTRMPSASERARARAPERGSADSISDVLLPA